MSKNKKIIYQLFSSENYRFYTREKLLYIAWACFRNGDDYAIDFQAARPVRLFFSLGSNEKKNANIFNHFSSQTLWGEVPEYVKDVQKIFSFHIIDRNLYKRPFLRYINVCFPRSH